MRHRRPELSSDETRARIVDPGLLGFVEEAAMRALDLMLPDRGYPADRGSHRERFRSELHRQLTGGAPEAPAARVRPPLRPPPPGAIWNDEDAEQVEVEIEDLLTSLDEEEARKTKDSAEEEGLASPPAACVSPPSAAAGDSADPPTLPATRALDPRDPPTLPTPRDAPTRASDTVRVLRDLLGGRRSRAAPAGEAPRGTRDEGAPPHPTGAGGEGAKQRVAGLMRRVYDFVLPPPQDGGIPPSPPPSR